LHFIYELWSQKRRQNTKYTPSDSKQSALTNSGKSSQTILIENPSGFPLFHLRRKRPKQRFRISLCRMDPRILRQQRVTLSDELARNLPAQQSGREHRWLVLCFCRVAVRKVSSHFVGSHRPPPAWHRCRRRWKRSQAVNFDSKNGASLYCPFKPTTTPEIIVRASRTAGYQGAFENGFAVSTRNFSSTLTPCMCIFAGNTTLVARLET